MRGRGSGSCGSHFIKQPGTRQRCSVRSGNEESTFTEDNHAVCNRELHHPYSLIQSQIQVAVLWQSAHLGQAVFMVTAFTIHHPPLFFPSSFITPSVFAMSWPFLSTTCPSHYWACYQCVCVCVSVYLPTRSGSLSLCEAPVIVGGLLL